MKGSENPMNDVFKSDEKLYRAVYPPEVAAMYWKRDGSLSPVTFVDPKGLSVDRGYYRDDADVKAAMKKRLTGDIVRFYVRSCNEVGAFLRYLPSKNNKYHTEIHGSADNRRLSRHQCYYLARRALKV